jgi:hypothetical protein
MNHPDHQLLIARDIQRTRMEQAERLRLVRAARRDRPVRSRNGHRAGSRIGRTLWIGRRQLEPC